jgi:hypothetical protein
VPQQQGAGASPNDRNQQRKSHHHPIDSHLVISCIYLVRARVNRGREKCLPEAIERGLWV